MDWIRFFVDKSFYLKFKEWNDTQEFFPVFHDSWCKIAEPVVIKEFTL